MSLPLRSSLFAAATALLLFPACSNSSSGSTTQTGNPGSAAEAPIASIQFPFGADVATDLDRLTVRGAASDPDGVQSIELSMEAAPCVRPRPQRMLLRGGKPRST